MIFNSLEGLLLGQLLKIISAYCPTPFLLHESKLPLCEGDLAVPLVCYPLDRDLLPAHPCGVLKTKIFDRLSGRIGFFLRIYKTEDSQTSPMLVGKVPKSSSRLVVHNTIRRGFLT